MGDERVSECGSESSCCCVLFVCSSNLLSSTGRPFVPPQRGQSHYLISLTISLTN